MRKVEKGLRAVYITPRIYVCFLFKSSSEFYLSWGGSYWDVDLECVYYIYIIYVMLSKTDKRVMFECKTFLSVMCFIQNLDRGLLRMCSCVQDKDIPVCIV